MLIVFIDDFMFPYYQIKRAMQNYDTMTSRCILKWYHLKMNIRRCDVYRYHSNSNQQMNNLQMLIQMYGIIIIDASLQDVQNWFAMHH